MRPTASRRSHVPRDRLPADDRRVLLRACRADCRLRRAVGPRCCSARLPRATRIWRARTSRCREPWSRRQRTITQSTPNRSGIDRRVQVKPRTEAVRCQPLYSAKITTGEKLHGDCRPPHELRLRPGPRRRVAEHCRSSAFMQSAYKRQKTPLPNKTGLPTASPQRCSPQGRAGWEMRRGLRGNGHG
jgi:hypothetical protein